MAFVRLKNGLRLTPLKSTAAISAQADFRLLPLHVFHPQPKRPMLRRMAGILWKGLWNLPDRVADKNDFRKMDHSPTLAVIAKPLKRRC